MLVLEAIGNLGADAIIKDLNGQKYIAFSVAHTESYKDSQGQRHERTTWVSCLKYGESPVINYLKKGTRQVLLLLSYYCVIKTSDLFAANFRPRHTKPAEHCKPV
jgi:hypothetical protein